MEDGGCMVSEYMNIDEVVAISKGGEAWWPVTQKGVPMSLNLVAYRPCLLCVCEHVFTERRDALWKIEGQAQSRL